MAAQTEDDQPMSIGESVHMRNWVLVAVALISMIMTILQVVLK